MTPNIFLLRESVEDKRGISHVVSNINACAAVVHILRSTLGPRGMDKLIVDSDGKATISNDGAKIMNLLDIIHPAAKTLVDIALSQDLEVGDGTTTVVLLAGELLQGAKSFLEVGVHPRLLIKAFRRACQLSISKIRDISINISDVNESKKIEILEKCATTALNSKLILAQKSIFATMVVNILSKLDSSQLDLQMLGIKKVKGGSIKESIYVDGVAFKKTFSYAGFEQQPKKLKNPKILLLNIELELKAEKENAEVRINDPSHYQSIVDAEWKIIYEKLEKCVKTGAKLVLSRLAIGDLATQFFADRKIFSAGRVDEDDLARTAEATGAKVQTSVNNIETSILGSCGIFEEKTIGNERFNFFTGCSRTHTCTIILRGCSEQYLDEADRSLHDAIMVVHRAIKNPLMVPGGGAIEIEISQNLHEKSRKMLGKAQIFIRTFANALEIIPRQLCDNAGLDSNNIISILRQKHRLPESKGVNFGVDIIEGKVCDTLKAYLWEPSIIKINALSTATEAACLLLSIDESIRNTPSDQTNVSSLRTT
jgi:T-complex protein 1 subunit eta